MATLVLSGKYTEFLLLANGMIVLLYFYAKKKKKQRAMEFGNYETLKKVAAGDFIKASNILLITRLLAVTSLIIGLSSPVIVGEEQRSRSDYVVVLDSSASMTATDIEPSRLQAAKDVAANFVSGLGNQSMIGVVSFSGEVQKEMPMTSSTSKARQAVKSIEMGATGGTAIGNAISTSTSMLLDSNRPRIVLVTDGKNNVGTSINESVDFAERQNVTIYPIGIGKESQASTEYRIIDGQNVSATNYANINQDKLRYIANQTGGSARFVTNRTALENAFVDLVSSKVRNDISMIFIWLAALLLILEWVVKTTDLEVIP
ncbi:MAG: VWA domain-containing protein [Candidatus Nanohalobium sp.]